MLVVLLAAAVVHAAPLQTHVLASGVTCTGPACTTEPHRSRYRLNEYVPDSLDMKEAALKTDGSACSVVGAKVCTSRPRTLLVTPID